MKEKALKSMCLVFISWIQFKQYMKGKNILQHICVHGMTQVTGFEFTVSCFQLIETNKTDSLRLGGPSKQQMILVLLIRDSLKSFLN